MVHFLDERIRALQQYQIEYENDDINPTDILPRVKRRIQDSDPVVVEVQRDKYSHVVPQLQMSPQGMINLIGGTGTGKSTFGILGLFTDPQRKVLSIQPNASNFANQMAEFNHLLPIINRKMGNHYQVIPRLQQFNLVSMFDVWPTDQFYCTTVADFVAYVRKYNVFPPFTTLILDEYHLISSEMSIATVLLSACEHNCEVIFTSATPPGRAVPPLINPDVEFIHPDGFVPDVPPKDVADTVWDPRHLFLARGYTAYFVPTSKIAHDLAASLTRIIPLSAIFVIDQYSTAKDFERMRDHSPEESVVILTPMVEAGITVPNLKVLIDSALTYTVVMEKGVVYEKERQLTAAERMQRFGRAGRVCKTYIITPKDIEEYDAKDAREFFQAEAIVLGIALGANYNQMPFKPVFAHNRLRTLTPSAAGAAMADTQFSPFTAIHRYASDGELYHELGGIGAGFSIDLIDDLRVYTYRKGSKFFIAPIVDLTSDLDPTMFMPDRLTSLGFSKAILRNVGDSSTFDEMIDLFALHPQRYMSDLVELLNREKKLTDKRFQNSLGANYTDMFNTDELIKFFSIVASVCPITRNTLGLITKDGTRDVIDQEYFFEWNGKRAYLALASDVLPDDPTKYDLSVTSAVYEEILLTVVSAATVITKTQRVTNLDEFADFISPKHSWYYAS